MNILKVCAFVLTALFLTIALKENNKDIAPFISIIAGIVVLIYIFPNISEIFKMLNNLTYTSNIEGKYLSLILKLAGITYLVEFGKNICCDLGDNSLGAKLELAGKVVIVTFTLPILSEILEMIICLM